MQHAASPRQPASHSDLPPSRPVPVYPISNATLGWSSVAALGFAGLVYLIARLTQNSTGKTFDICVGDLTEGSSERMVEVLAE